MIFKGLIALLLLGCNVALADTVYDYTYTDITNPQRFSVSGTFTVGNTQNPDGSYPILSITGSGVYSELTLEGLLPPEQFTVESLMFPSAGNELLLNGSQPVVGPAGEGLYFYASGVDASGFIIGYNGTQVFWAPYHPGGTDGGGDLVSSSITAVPLPSSGWLMLVGAFGLGAMARQRRTAFTLTAS